MDNEAIFGIMMGGVSVVILFVILPWIILHYVTRWKANSRLTAEDEAMLDDLYELARRLDDRMATLERIIAADQPDQAPLPSVRLERHVDEMVPLQPGDRMASGRKERR